MVAFAHVWKHRLILTPTNENGPPTDSDRLVNESNTAYRWQPL